MSFWSSLNIVDSPLHRMSDSAVSGDPPIKTNRYFIRGIVACLSHEGINTFMARVSKWYAHPCPTRSMFADFWRRGDEKNKTREKGKEKWAREWGCGCKLGERGEGYSDSGKSKHLRVRGVVWTCCYWAIPCIFRVVGRLEWIVVWCVLGPPELLCDFGIVCMIVMWCDWGVIEAFSKRKQTEMFYRIHLGFTLALQAHKIRKFMARTYRAHRTYRTYRGYGAYRAHRTYRAYRTYRTYRVFWTYITYFREI